MLLSHSRFASFFGWRSQPARPHVLWSLPVLSHRVSSYQSVGCPSHCLISLLLCRVPSQQLCFRFPRPAVPLLLYVYHFIFFQPVCLPCLLCFFIGFLRSCMGGADLGVRLLLGPVRSGGLITEPLPDGQAWGVCSSYPFCPILTSVIYHDDIFLPVSSLYP